MYPADRPATPHPVTESVLVGRKIIKTNEPTTKHIPDSTVIEESPQKISQ